MHRISVRIADALVLFWLVLTLTFALVHLAPGDPATLLVPPGATGADAARMHAELGLDAPLPEQYARWIGAVLRGDLGTSIMHGKPVRQVISEAAPVSLFLGGVSLSLSFVFGVLLGLWQALAASRRADRAVSVAATVVYAAPSFWLALALVTLFTTGAVWLSFPSWLRLPAFGMEDPGALSSGWMDRWRHAVLPLVVLAVPGAAGIARYARQSIREAALAPHVVSAVARGLPRSRVTRTYIVRNALTPLVVLFGLTLPGVIAGSVFVEQIFAWPGMGRSMLEAVSARDYPLVLGFALIYAGAVIMSNLLADVLLLRLDPRRRA